MKLKNLFKDVIISILFLCNINMVYAVEYTFKLHHFLSASSPVQTKMLVPWIKKVEDNAGGKVKIKIFPSMTLGGRPSELINQVRDGVVDIIWTVNGYTPGVFLRTEVFELPTVFKNNPIATNLAMNEMFNKYLVKDYEDIKVLFLHVHAGQGMHLVNKEIRNPNDLIGVKMRIPTRTGSWALESLGAIPVSISVPNLPQSLAKNLIDGALIPWEIIAPLQLQTQTQYQIELVNRERIGTTTFQVSMNKKKWNSLPKDIKLAFLKASDTKWLIKIGKLFREIDNYGINIAIKAGNKHIILDEKESIKFRVILKKVVDRWVKEMIINGINGQLLVDKARELITKYEGR